MLAQAQLPALRLRPIDSDHKREGRGNLHRNMGKEGMLSVEWHLSRVLTAAEFTGQSLIVRLMTLRRGDSIELNVSVSPNQTTDSRAYQWRYGRQSTYPPVPPVWPLPNADPWERSRYAGLLNPSPQNEPNRVCPSCGASRTNQANYCGNCGSPFDSMELVFAERVAQIAGDAAVGSATVGSDIAGVIETYTQLRARLPKGGAELLEFIRDDFAGSVSARFLRGEPATVTPDLTLAIAQDIHQTIAATNRVRADQRRHAELILRYAPLRFGYWGAFKALVKSVPAEDMPDAYADALARLSSYDAHRAPPQSVRVEDVAVLDGFSGTPSPETLEYLARRVRRDLAALADRSPDIYARLAARMIWMWDDDLSRRAFAPAYVMLGARTALDAHGKHVVRQPDMSTRRDAHPDIWDERPELVEEVFDTVENSVEALTWSFQVLESLGRTPTITADCLSLAVRSTYPPLYLAASAALATRPGLWDSLTVAQWSALLRREDANTDAVLDALSIGTPRPSAVEAARDFLASSESGTPIRRLRASVVYLSSPPPSLGKKVDVEASITAVVEVISQGARKYQKLWRPVIKQLGVEELQRVRNALPDKAPRSALKGVDDQLITKRAAQANPFEANRWITSDNPLESKLGWGLLQRSFLGFSGLLNYVPQWISRDRPDPSTIHRVVGELVARASTKDLAELSSIVGRALGRGVSPHDLAAELVKTQLGRSVIWQVLAGKPNAGLLDVTPDIVRVTTDEITAEQLGSAAPGQLRFVLRYLEENPARIADDMAFGVAAATSRDRALQTEAIKQLQANGQLPDVWMSLAHSSVPKARTAARTYVTGLDGREFRDAVLQCMDSEDPALNDMGTTLLEKRMARRDDHSLWTALAESDDRRIAALVAKERDLANRVDDRVLHSFDQRVLCTSRHSRRVKEMVKSRIIRDVDLGIAPADRIATLLEVARGQILTDREWALEKLAELALSGVAIEGLEVSLVTDGGAQ